MVTLFSVEKSSIHRVLVPRMVLELSNDVGFSVSLQLKSVSPFSLSLFFLNSGKCISSIVFQMFSAPCCNIFLLLGPPSFCTLALLSSVALALLFILSNPIPSPSGDDRSQCPPPHPRHIPQTKWLDWQSSHCNPATAPPMVFQPIVNNKNSTVKLKINLTLFNNSWIGQCPIWQVEIPPPRCRKERFV